jgi:hypothetical protein
MQQSSCRHGVEVTCADASCILLTAARDTVSPSLLAACSFVQKMWCAACVSCYKKLYLELL